MRDFNNGYKRTAVVIVPTEETFAERQKLREERDGKDVPDGAVLEMKGTQQTFNERYNFIYFLLVCATYTHFFFISELSRFEQFFLSFLNFSYFKIVANMSHISDFILWKSLLFLTYLPLYI